ncbi:unnamed protein product [Adineta steineri]|uniref:Uncharacterized protein n=1 Tax=Adineta steineri TaxID=433720 RepID=A0A819VDB4_9BILA|nr:unnamed protein product [Adineta steineri]CAF4107119.1 unnamed protein product [Adineta steineri]
MFPWSFTNLPSIKILLTENNEKNYFLGGEKLSGKLVSHTNQPVSIENLCLSLTVKLWESTNSVPVSASSVPMSSYRDQLLYEKEIRLCSPSDEDISFVDTETSDVLYTLFTFKFKIPDDFPSSIRAWESSGSTSIEYSLILEYIRSDKEPKKIQQLLISVFSHVSPPENQNNIELVEKNRDDVSVRVQINRGYVLSDERQLPLEINIENPKGKIIKEIKYHLMVTCFFNGSVQSYRLSDSESASDELLDFFLRKLVVPKDEVEQDANGKLYTVLVKGDSKCGKTNAPCKNNGSNSKAPYKCCDGTYECLSGKCHAKG